MPGVRSSTPTRQQAREPRLHGLQEDTPSYEETPGPPGLLEQVLKLQSCQRSHQAPFGSEKAGHLLVEIKEMWLYGS
jgi:hypothetical protein